MNAFIVILEIDVRCNERTLLGNQLDGIERCRCAQTQIIRTSHRLYVR